MPRFADGFGIQRKRLLSAAAFLAIVAPIMSVLLISAPSRAQSQTQSAAVAAPEFVYEVASVKPSKSTDGNMRINTADDGLVITNLSPNRLVQLAFRFGISVTDAPEWMNSESYDIDAKMEASVADALKKLSPDDRRIARQHMLQALLVDRFTLTFHRESKELPVYFLSVAKNGPKLHEAKPGDTYPNGIPLPAGRSGGGARIMMMSGGIGDADDNRSSSSYVGNLIRSLARFRGPSCYR